MKYCIIDFDAGSSRCISSMGSYPKTKLLNLMFLFSRSLGSIIICNEHYGQKSPVFQYFNPVVSPSTKMCRSDLIYSVNRICFTPSKRTLIFLSVSVRNLRLCLRYRLIEITGPFVKIKNNCRSHRLRQRLFVPF